jgi:hypothetical protein
MRPGAIAGNATLSAHVRRACGRLPGAAMLTIAVRPGALGRMRVRRRQEAQCQSDGYR